MYFYSLIENLQLRIAAPKFEFGCGFYFCVIGALKYIIGFANIPSVWSSKNCDIIYLEYRNAGRIIVT